MVPETPLHNFGPCRWDYLPTVLGRTGRNLSENNFAKERRDWLAILLREILQNALDAKRRDAPSVQVFLDVREVEQSLHGVTSSLLTEHHTNRYRASLGRSSETAMPQVDRYLVAEDFGTCGLTGTVDDWNRDGRGENWNSFWFREGEGGKEYSAGNGGAGQGKITCFSTSSLRTMFAYTVRADDGRGCVFGASSFQRDYEYQGRKWRRDAYWGLWSGDGEARTVRPDFSLGSIAAFRNAFGLRRGPDDRGLSLVIPSPKSFDSDAAIEIVLAEFFVPIYRGDLEVQVGQIRIDSASVSAMADARLSDKRARELSTCMTAGYREFVRHALSRSADSANHLELPLVRAASDIVEGAFDVERLEALRQAYANDEIVSVRVPVAVKRRTETPVEVGATFDVYLAQCFELDQAEQAVIRRDLLIGEEPVGVGRLKQRVRGLTVISDDELSRLLLSAEEATHLRWNTRLPRLGEYFRDGASVVAIVRSAMARVLDVLTEADKKRDFKLLAKYFSAPGTLANRATRGVKSRGDKPPSGPENLPLPKAKLLRIETVADGCFILPQRNGCLSEAKLPLHVKVQFAYEGLDKDAFAEYDPLDFNLQDKSFELAGAGCTLLERAFNQLKLTVDREPFALKVRGFDPNLRLRVRVTYEEAADATPVDTQ